METGKSINLSQANEYVSNARPIVFWDTCALLDIVRIPIRDNLSTNELDCYEGIAEYISNEQIVSVTSELVLMELDDHYGNICNELLIEQKKLQSSVKDYTEYMEDEDNRRSIAAAMDLLDARIRLIRVIECILKKTLVIKVENTYRDFANYRMLNRIAPAARKMEYKDCYIWGTFLSLVHSIDQNIPYAAFMTTNYKDYEVSKGKVYPQISKDCYLPSMKIRLHIGKLKSDLDEMLNDNH